jgi:hypothetical protein
LTAAERLESETVAENNPTAKAAKEQQINSWKQTAAQYESEPETQEGRKELAERAKYAEERRSWKLLQLQPKSPTIIAPRLRTDGLGSNDFAVAGGGNVAGVAIANFRDRQGSARSPEEAKAIYEREKNDIEYPFSLSDYKQSCAVYVRGQKVSRRQLVLYVAHKKGGAHLDHTRKKDKQAYCALDAAIESGWSFGASPAGQSGQEHGKNPVYLELLSIGQNLTNSPDIRRFMDGASNVLDRCR